VIPASIPASTVIHFRGNLNTDLPQVPRRPITREQLEREPGQVISPGRWANAVLSLRRSDGEQWVVKDFRARSFVVRNTIGRFLIRRELQALGKVAGLNGVPADAFRVDPHALAYRFIPGTPLTQAVEERKSAEFFAAFEHALAEVHTRGIVHLDVRNGRNVLVTEGGRAALIDFQSHLGTTRLPRAMRAWMERFDMAGVYKHWERHHPQSLGETRAALLAGMNRWRRLWPFRGYLGVRNSDPGPR
jgi:RIO-like serine/threonine protein kinase